MDRKSSALHIVGLLGILLLGLGLRLLWLTESPLRGDEVFAITYWAAPWPEGLVTTQIEPHPFGTFALFALWRGMFGDGEWVMRLLPALLSIPGIAASYALSKRLFKCTHAGLLAALFYATHPFLIWHAQDVRNYAIWLSFSLITLLAYLRAIEHNRRRDWIVFVIAAATSVYIFFFEAFFLAAQACYLLIAHRKRWKEGLLAGITLSILMIPWLWQIIAIVNGSGYGGTAGGDPLPLTTFLAAFAAGVTLPANVTPIVGIVAGIIWMVGMATVRRESPKPFSLLLTTIIVPVILFLLAITQLDMDRPRYLLPLTVIGILISAGLASRLTTRSRLSGLGASGLVIMLYAWSLSGYYDPQYQKAADFRTLGHFFTAVTTPGDLIVQQATDPAFGYYYRGTSDEAVLPTYALAPAEETADILETYRETYDSIWFFPSDQPWYDPEHVPQTWLEQNMQQTAQVTIGAFEVFQFQPWDVDALEYQHDLAVAFGDSAFLLDWQLDRIGNTLRLTLYWEPITQPDRPLSGFAHLIGPPQPDTGWTIWVQDDHVVTAILGEPGQVRRDVYQLALPESLPDAEWQINFGLYDPASSVRIVIGDADHIVIDVDSALMTP